MFNSYPVLLQAAIDGQGVALGTAELLDAVLENGTLVRPLGEEYRTGRGYYLALPARRPVSPRVTALYDWLLGGVSRTPERLPMPPRRG